VNELPLVGQLSEDDSGTDPGFLERARGLRSGYDAPFEAAREEDTLRALRLRPGARR
jgi:hypothetical protein